MMKKAIFNIVIYSMLVWTMLSATYMALPPDIQSQLPQINWLTALVSGSSTALVGTAGLVIKSFLNKTSTETDSKVQLVAEQFLNLVDKYTTLEEKYDNLVANIKRTSALIEADLKAKLDNPMISDATRELIEGVLNDKEG